MKAFAELYAELDASTRSTRKREAIVAYLRHAPPRDAAHAIAVLCGQRPRRVLSSTRLRELAAQAAQLPVWLVDESYHHVGDLAETLALLLPPPRAPQDRPLHHWLEDLLPKLARSAPEEQATQILQYWDTLPAEHRLIFNKLLTGGLRVGVARLSVVQALAEFLQREPGVIAARLMGRLQADEHFFTRLAAEELDQGLAPYPFQLAQALDEIPQPLSDWQCEWKWDGIRAQLVLRDGLALWSRGEEEISASFPELVEAAAQLPRGTVLDGEILAFDRQVLPFASLQRRLQRKKPSPALQNSVPVVFYAYDLLELGGVPLRDAPQTQRRAQLQALLPDAQARLRVAPLVEAADADALSRLRLQAREHAAEGLMLKRRDAVYSGGRPRGVWWKWKLDPYSVDAVLVYAQAGHGRRANLYTDYTLAVWYGEVLVPVAKAYSGLSDAEISELDRWIRAHTTERFGPVRAVQPLQVFELGFEGIQSSTRHKAGVALRFPRILRWRRDKPAQQADQLSALRALLGGSKAVPT